MAGALGQKYGPHQDFYSTAIMQALKELSEERRNVEALRVRIASDKQRLEDLNEMKQSWLAGQFRNELRKSISLSERKVRRAQSGQCVNKFVLLDTLRMFSFCGRHTEEGGGAKVKDEQKEEQLDPEWANAKQLGRETMNRMLWTAYRVPLKPFASESSASESD